MYNTIELALHVGCGFGPPSQTHRKPELQKPRPPTRVHPNPFHQTQSAKCKKHQVYLVDEEYLVTALVPSETACFASSPGKISRTLIYQH